AGRRVRVGGSGPPAESVRPVPAALPGPPGVRGERLPGSAGGAGPGGRRGRGRPVRRGGRPRRPGAGGGRDGRGRPPDRRVGRVRPGVPPAPAGSQPGPTLTSGRSTRYWSFRRQTANVCCRGESPVGASVPVNGRNTRSSPAVPASR